MYRQLGLERSNSKKMDIESADGVWHENADMFWRWFLNVDRVMTYVQRA